MKSQIRDVGDVRVISLTGKIAIGSGDVMLRQLINENLEQNHKKLLLDLRGVNSMDSSGIGEMVASYTSAKNRDAQLKLMNLSPKINDILQVTQLITVFDVFDNEEEAIAAFS
ncbi:MAG: STAS domain-containing protein [Thermoanaerobaculales bacterium]|nr:STAS domain-containing protein [Thermoanaerobaculales bacterium]